MNVWLDKEDDPHPEHTEEMQGRNPEMFFKENSEKAKMKAFILFVVEKDEFGNSLLDYLGTSTCPDFNEAVRMFEQRGW